MDSRGRYLSKSSIGSGRSSTSRSYLSRRSFSAPRYPYSMTEDDLQKRSKQSRGRLITQLYAGLTASISAICFGTILGWSSPAYHQLAEDKRETTWIASLAPLGIAVGVIPWCYAMENFGPKKSLIIQAPFFILTWVLSASVNYNHALTLSMRFFSGLLGVSHRICSEQLLMETVHRSLAAGMYVIYKSSLFLGASATILIGLYVNNRSLSLFCLCFPILHFILLCFVPESPVFLFKKSEIMAEKSLSWYRGRSNIYTDMRLIRRDCDYYKLEVDTYRYMIYSKVVLKPALILAALQLIRVCTCYFLLVMYSSSHVLYGAKHHADPTHIHQVLGVTIYVSTTFWTSIHVRYELPVRKCLIASCLSCSLFLMCIATGLFFPEYMYSHFRWIPPLYASLLIFSSDIGLNHLPMALVVSYMPFQVYRLVNRYLLVLQWFGIFMLLRTFHQLSANKNVYILFVVMSVICFAGAFFCYIFVIEVKGKSLIRIQLEFGGNPVGNRSAHLTRLFMKSNKSQSHVFDSQVHLDVESVRDSLPTNV